jgi:triosephosphate isomerase
MFMRSMIIGNWKMHGSCKEAESLAGAVREQAASSEGIEVGCCPPFVHLETVGKVLKGSPVWWGGQDSHEERQGAYTGEVSAAMLKDLGCRYVILGHSERRRGLGESDARICKKARAALQEGLSVILCVGETLAERKGGNAEGVVTGQLVGSLEGMSAADPERLVIAYEPIWAIGTGVNATPDEASEMHGLVRGWMGKRFGPAGGKVRILYGGSVKPDNAAELLSQEGIDGALVGGASLKAESFGAILEAARR